LICVISSRTVSAEKLDPARLIDILRDGIAGPAPPEPDPLPPPALGTLVDGLPPALLADTLPPPPKDALLILRKLAACAIAAVAANAAPTHGPPIRDPAA
jgi:hypothetical protein